MNEPRTDRDAARGSAGQPAEPIRYPTNHVVGVVDTAAEVESAVTALTAGGFLDSEIEAGCGPALADALDASTGRRGLVNLALRVAQRLGIANDELMMKERYEEALRDGQFVISVLAPTEERRERAAQILRDHGAHFINFLGRFTMEAVEP